MRGLSFVTVLSPYANQKSAKNPPSVDDFRSRVASRSIGGRLLCEIPSVRTRQKAPQTGQQTIAATCSIQLHCQRLRLHPPSTWVSYWCISTSAFLIFRIFEVGNVALHGYVRFRCTVTPSASVLLKRHSSHTKLAEIHARSVLPEMARG